VTIDRTDEGNKIVNQYVILGKLGSGAYAKVKLCMSTEDNELYAMKVVHKSVLRKKRVGSTTALDDVMREISIMKKLNHPNVAKLFEVINDPDEDTLFMIMEYLEGGAVMKRTMEPLALPMVHRYFCDVLAGLEYLHAQKIVHRDIKPENLLLAKHGTVKISDFGVSHVFSGDDDALKQSAGSPAFLAPELCSAGTSPHGLLVDVWALGVTLYCMVFGTVPFMAENVLDIYEKIRTEPVRYPSTIPADLQDLLSNLLEKDPSRRITTEGIRKHPWVSGGSSSSNNVHTSPPLTAPTIAPPPVKKSL